MSDVSPALSRLVEARTQSVLAGVEVVQTLWGGYGQLLRCHLVSDDRPSVVVKHVRRPTTAAHPRGWNTDRSHQRKERSYQVEMHWYRRYASACTSLCRVPTCLAVDFLGDDVVIMLEDLDCAGFAARRSEVTRKEIDACLTWLAHFHATFLGRRPEGLWDVGTYWHLATRPDEWAALDDGPLKRHAAEIDRSLSASHFLTFVHGDAKLANFCFSSDGCSVAAVDFQYVGGGCGMKDVAYFVSSCLDETQSERLEQTLLDSYFAALERAVATIGSDVNFAALERDWRSLYPVAWTDFYRFLQGWSPGHWKIHRYSERMARDVLAAL